MEQFLCNLVPENKDLNCSDYPVKLENTNTHICINDIANNKCKEQFLCDLVPGNMTEINCSDYPVKPENIDTHTCV